MANCLIGRKWTEYSLNMTETAAFCVSTILSETVLPEHKDPFDKLLLEQAQEEGLRLLAVDRFFPGDPLSVAARELK